MKKNVKISSGLTWGGCMGIALATCISWCRWNSILWAIIHGFLSWFYVIYYAIKF